jgi:hypothetical protein
MKTKRFLRMSDTPASRITVPRIAKDERAIEETMTLCTNVLATDPEARVRFPALPKKTAVGLERGPLSLVSTTEELLDRKVAAPV